MFLEQTVCRHFITSCSKFRYIPCKHNFR